MGLSISQGTGLLGKSKRLAMRGRRFEEEDPWSRCVTRMLEPSRPDERLEVNKVMGIAWEGQAHAGVAATMIR